MHRRQRWAPGPPPRAWARSAASSAPRTRISCLSNAHNTGTVSAFQDSAAGILSPIGISRFADQQTAPCWVEITHDGRFLCTVSTGSGTISRYMIAPGGALTLLGSTPVGATGGRVSAGPDLPAARRPDRSHPGRRRHRVFHGGRNTSSTFRTWLRPAGLVVRLVASFRTGRITRGLEPKRPRQSCPASAHARKTGPRWAAKDTGCGSRHTSTGQTRRLRHGPAEPRRHLPRS